MEVDIKEIVDSPRRAIALVDDAEKGKMLHQFVDASAALVEAAVRNMVVKIVEDINGEVSRHYRVRLIQEGERLLVEVNPQQDAFDQRGWRFNSSDIDKVFLRVPAELKSRAKEAAKNAGVSLNTWSINILERALVSLKKVSEERQEGGTAMDQ